MKYLFCDIDGVLNYSNCDCDISKERVILLKQIIDQTGAKLIINSKTSCFKSIYEQRIKTIEEYGLCIDDQIIRTTLNTNSKAIECIAYLSRHTDVENVLVLDDNDDEYSLYFKNNLILIDPRIGINEQCVKLSINLLGVKEN